jgi:two-component system, LytTR family, sensor kinase
MIMGVALSQALNYLFNGIVWRPERLLPALVFGGLVLTVFVLHDAGRQAREEALVFRAAAAESRYHVLEQQMRPHFLFNSLNVLAEMIESGNTGSAAAAHRLSDLYRQILANSK